MGAFQIYIYMYVCVYIYIYIYLRARARAHTHTHTHTSMAVHIYIYIAFDSVGSLCFFLIPSHLNRALQDAPQAHMLLRDMQLQHSGKIKKKLPPSPPKKRSTLDNLRCFCGTCSCCTLFDDIKNL
jgi:hypothetical protein